MLFACVEECVVGGDDEQAGDGDSLEVATCAGDGASGSERCVAEDDDAGKCVSERGEQERREVVQADLDCDERTPQSAASRRKPAAGACRRSETDVEDMDTTSSTTRILKVVFYSINFS